MARIKYYYDTETCKYERIKVTTWDIILNLLGFFVFALVLSVVIVFVFNYYFESPKEAMLVKENKELKLYNEIHNKKITELSQMLDVLQDRDDNVYRVIFEAEPIPESVRKGGIGGAERYKDLLREGLEQEELIIETFNKIDQLKKRMYIQTKSYDDILSLAKNKEKMWASIPAIQPISNKELKRLASGFGMRIHPIYKQRRMHTGVDFSAPRGTPIYSTGDGVVEEVINSLGGYGKQVVIDHGFGYKTRYAHMQKFNVKVGQKIKRGEVIGFVGNTGRSTAPHLHYEVIKNGKNVNPAYYFYQDLTPEEYEELLRLASIENQSLS